MDPIVKRLLENHKVNESATIDLKELESKRYEITRLSDSNLYEMANIKKSRTGLPYDIWVDSAGSSRDVQHNSPRLKIDIDGDLIPFSISDHPEMLVNKKIPHETDLITFIKDNNEVLLKHWNGEIDDGQIINYLTLIYKKGVSREEAYTQLDEL